MIPERVRVGLGIWTMLPIRDGRSRSLDGAGLYASQHLNRKLRDIAAEVEQTGQLPDVPAGKTDG